MSVQINQKYEATVTSAAVTVNDKGTLGLGISYATVDGPISKTWYITASTVDRFKEMVFKCFGVTEERLQDEGFIQNGFGRALANQPCEITTQESKDKNGNVRTDKNGVPYAEVQWMNPSRLGRKADADGIKRVVSIFGGTPSSGSANQKSPTSDPGGDWPSDGDAPF